MATREQLIAELRRGRIRPGIALADQGGPDLPEARPAGEIGQDWLQIGKDVSGYSTAEAGVGNVQQGWQENDPVRVAGGVGQVGMAALPYGLVTRTGRAALGAATSTVPRAMAAGGSLGVPEALISTANAQTDPFSQVKTQISGIESKRSELARSKALLDPDSADPKALQEVLRSRGFDLGPTGVDGKIGARTRAAAIAAQRAIDGEIAAFDSSINELRGQMSPEAIQKLNTAADQAKATYAKETPFRERYAPFMPLVPIAANAMAGGAGALVRSGFNRHHREALNSLTDRLAGAVTKKKNGPLAHKLRDEIEKVTAKGSGGTAATLTTGALIGGKVSLVPEEIDYWAGVDGAHERMFSADTAQRLAVAAGMGAGAAHLGGTFADRASQAGMRPQNLNAEIDLLPKRRPKAASTKQGKPQLSGPSQPGSGPSNTPVPSGQPGNQSPPTKPRQARKSSGQQSGGIGGAQGSSSNLQAVLKALRSMY